MTAQDIADMLKNLAHLEMVAIHQLDEVDRLLRELTEAYILDDNYPGRLASNMLAG